MKTKELKYSIGSYVVVSVGMCRRVEMCRGGNESVSWYPLNLPKPQLGQIVGLTTKYSGRIERSANWEAPCYFTPVGTFVFWQVKFGLLNKPILVQDRDMRLARIDEVKELPRLFIRPHPMSDIDKKYLSEDSKKWPRDSKGRWIAGPVTHK